MKNISIIFIVLILTIGVCGCKMDKKENIQETQYAMQQYFENKYGIYNYEILGFEEKCWTHAYDLLTIETEEYNYVEIRRVVNNENIEYKDNYFGYLIKEKYEKHISKYLNEFIKEFHITAGTSSIEYPYKYRNSQQFQELLEDIDSAGLNKIMVTVTIPYGEVGENMNDFVTDFYKKYGEKDLPTLWRFFEISDKNYLQYKKSDFADEGKLDDYVNKIIK